MKVLVINSGSSSIKYKLFEDKNEIYGGMKSEVTNYKTALDNIFEELVRKGVIESFESLDGVGHRVVHGGEKFSNPVIIDDDTINEIEKLIPLAPLHNPVNLKAIKIIKEQYPKMTQTAVFDTAYHQTMPQSSYLYPLPFELYENYNIRRYGFHGTSHYHIMKKTAQFLNKDIKKINLITLHLGNGCSACAIKNGQSIDTSMGFTPLEGLMMGTRCGDIDPSIVTYLQRVLECHSDECDNILNKRSGFKGICGLSDLRKIEELAANGDEKCLLALDMFIQRVKKYIGAYYLELEDLDAIVFTGGIGENSTYIREMVSKSLAKSIGAVLDRNKNENINNDIEFISDKNSKIKLIVASTNEEKEIASQTISLIKGTSKNPYVHSLDVP
ncbi:MAG: acetate kinase [Campylobacterota bacterium]|nr:acetate kinase [Campylobacterota bacterium]